MGCKVCQLQIKCTNQLLCTDNKKNLFKFAVIKQPFCVHNYMNTHKCVQYHEEFECANVQICKRK